MSLFSDNLRYLRNAKRYTQQRLADELIITRSRLAKYEEGKSEPPFEVLKRISVFFQVSIDALIREELGKEAS